VEDRQLVKRLRGNLKLLRELRRTDSCCSFWKKALVLYGLSYAESHIPYHNPTGADIVFRVMIALMHEHRTKQVEPIVQITFALCLLLACWCRSMILDRRMPGPELTRFAEILQDCHGTALARARRLSDSSQTRRA